MLPQYFPGKPKYKVHLCTGCIKELDNDYPYIMVREQLEIIKVPIVLCDNFHANLVAYNERLTRRNPAWNDLIKTSEEESNNVVYLY